MWQILKKTQAHPGRGAPALRNYLYYKGQHITSIFKGKAYSAFKSQYILLTYQQLRKVVVPGELYT